MQNRETCTNMLLGHQLSDDQVNNGSERGKEYRSLEDRLIYRINCQAIISK